MSDQALSKLKEIYESGFITEEEYHERLTALTSGNGTTMPPRSPQLPSEEPHTPVVRLNSKPRMGRLVYCDRHVWEVTREGIARGSYGVISEVKYAGELNPVTGLVSITRKRHKGPSIGYLKEAKDRTDEDHLRYMFMETEALRDSRFRGNPNIVPIMDYSSSEQSPCVVMEICKYSLLHMITTRHPRLVVAREEEAVYIALDILNALIDIHSIGRIHGDISARNIMVMKQSCPTRKRRYVLIDFGSTSRMGEPARGPITEVYAAPERRECAPSEGRSDVYAVGVLLSEILTGMPCRHADEINYELLKCSRLPIDEDVQISNEPPTELPGADEINGPVAIGWGGLADAVASEAEEARRKQEAVRAEQLERRKREEKFIKKRQQQREGLSGADNDTVVKMDEERWRKFFEGMLATDPRRRWDAAWAREFLVINQTELREANRRGRSKGGKRR